MAMLGGTRNIHWRAILKWTGIGLGTLIILLAAIIGGVTLWLTPDRLTRIVNERASAALNADVKAYNIRFTLWSTFPHLDIELDSINVRSRNFDSIPVGLRRRLPANADFLLSTSRLRGGINFLKLIGNRIWLRDVEVDSLRVNLVDVTDSLNNYSIMPSGGKHRVPYFNIDGLSFKKGGSVHYTSLPSQSHAEVELHDMSLNPTREKDSYLLAISGIVSAESDGLTILRRFPFGLGGKVDVRFNPFGVATSDYRISLGSITGRMSMDMDLGDEASLNRFNYRLDDFTIEDLCQLLPQYSQFLLKKLTADLAVDCSARLTSPYNFDSAYLPSIDVDFRVPGGTLTYSFSDDRRYEAKNVTLRGRLAFNGRHPEDSYIEIPELRLEAAGATIEGEGSITQLTDEPKVRAGVHGSINLAESAKIFKELRHYKPAGNVAYEGTIDFRLTGDTLKGNIAGIKLRSPAASLWIDGKKMTLNDFHAEGNFSGKPEAPGIHALDFMAASRNLTYGDGETHFRVSSPQVSISTTRRRSARKSPQYNMPAAWHGDARTLSFARHTPELIHMEITDAIRNTMQNWETHLDVQAGGAEMINAEYGTPVRMGRMDLTATFDSVVLHNVKLESGHSEGILSARIRNLRQFLTSYSPAPLLLDITANFDTLQLNQLAHIYSGRHDATPDSLPSPANEEIDSKAYIIPRNLRLNLNLAARETRYINLHLYDLFANLTTEEGVASIDTLHVAADFGKADLKLRYNTADMQNISIDAALGIDSLNVVGFFDNFHALAEMYPQMRNLSGTLGCDIRGRVLVFPDMSLNVPSLWANGYVTGRDLLLHQNHFIRHVTSMLLIPTDKDLHIDNMNIHAGVHSNLLEVFPFLFEVEQYKLSLGGLNNFAGDLYYHIGVENWPLRMPFGINVKGTYSNPELRFGGKAWHDSNGAMITRGVEDSDRVNVVEEVRKYSRKLVHTAATYQGD